ncbi:MAG: PD-(D/E)XK nuclease family protein [Opitutales bacterium]|nr:PD-(D/E)XK nuclease family protein [Opitutales bacterium]
MFNRIFKTPETNNAKTAADFIFENLKPSKSNFIFEGAFVLAPTNSAAKAVLKELASRAEEEFGGGLAGLEVLTLEAFLSGLCRKFPCANSVERIFALRSALDCFESLPALFPKGIAKNPMPDKFFGDFLAAKSLCANAGLSVAEAAKKAGKYFLDEASRWQELAEFDGEYARALGRASKIDPADALLKALEGGIAAPKKIFLAGIADAPKIFRMLLGKFDAQQCEIFSVIFAEPSLENEFDEYGAPIPKKWTEKDLEIPGASIFLAPNRSAQAQMIAAGAAEMAAAAQACAIACEEGESSIAISEALLRRGLKSFSPEGEKLSQGEIFDFLEALKNYYSNRDLDSAKALAQKSALLKYLEKTTGKKPAEVLQALDFYSLEKLCPDIDFALENFGGEEGAGVLKALKNLLEDGEGGGNSQKISRILQRVFSQTSTCGGNIQKQAENLRETLAQIEAAENKFGHILDMRETIASLAKSADMRVFADAANADEIQLKNWIEIFWSKEPNIFLADFNDGQVPESIAGDALLPNLLREELGIRGAKSRHARDAYYLYCILKPRAPGAVKICVPQTDFNADPLRPSRLLYQTRNLVERVNRLFGEAKSPKHSSAFSAPWQFALPKMQMPKTLNATDFKTYIESPLNFYIEKILRLNSFDHQKREPDDRDVGNIVHGVLKNLKDFKGCEEEKIFAFLKGKFEESFSKKYGGGCGGVLKFLRVFLLSRLRAAAEVEARHRSAGWETIFTETDLGKINPEAALEIEGVKINAKIDRIDLNKAKKEYMVIDYKTSSSGKNPEADHYKKAGKDPGWVNLQLPIYAMCAKKFFPDAAAISTAYFVLPNASSETEIKKWEIKEDQLGGAEEKAKEIVKDIKTAFKNGSFEAGSKSPLAKYNPELFGFMAKNKSSFFKFGQ